MAPLTVAPFDVLCLTLMLAEKLNRRCLKDVDSTSMQYSTRLCCIGIEGPGGWVRIM